MARDKTIRFRVSAPEKERIEAHCEALAVETGRWLRELALRESALRPVVIAAPEPLDAQGVELSGGLRLGKSSFAPREQSPPKRTFRPDPKPK